MIKVLARKNKTSLADEALPEGLAGHGFSGADIESIVLSAKRTALTQAREVITREDLDRAIKDFIPSAQGLEKEKQELAAVLECTSMSFLPEVWRAARRLAGRPRQAPGTHGRHPPADRGVRSDANKPTISPEAQLMSTKPTARHSHPLARRKNRGTPLIDQYVQRLGSFMDAMADGKIDAERAEVAGSAGVGPDENRRARARRQAARTGHPPALRALGLQHHAHAAPAHGEQAKDEISRLNGPPFPLQHRSSDERHVKAMPEAPANEIDHSLIASRECRGFPGSIATETRGVALRLSAMPPDSTASTAARRLAAGDDDIGFDGERTPI